MRTSAEHTFEGQSNSVAVTLILPRDVHQAWTGFLLESKRAPGIDLRIILESDALQALRESEAVHKRARARYQSPGVSYVRFSVKLHWHTWAGLQVVARGLGVSTCYLITALIRQSLSRKSVGTPTERIRPAFNVVHHLMFGIEMELTRTYLRRTVCYERKPRNARWAHLLASRRPKPPPDH